MLERLRWGSTLAQALHLPTGAALALFALGMMISWIGHAIEEYQAHRLIRARALCWVLSSSPKLSKGAVRRLNVRTKSPLSRGAILHQKSQSTKGDSS